MPLRTEVSPTLRGQFPERFAHPPYERIHVPRLVEFVEQDW